MNRRLTLNLGLRYEYESAPVDAQNRFTRFLDLNTANATLQSNPPQYTPAELGFRSQYLARGPKRRLRTATGSLPTAATGRSSNPPGLNLAPRLGLAFRINNKTALNAGYGRFLS